MNFNHQNILLIDRDCHLVNTIVGLLKHWGLCPIVAPISTSHSLPKLKSYLAAGRFLDDGLVKIKIDDAVINVILIDVDLGKRHQPAGLELFQWLREKLTVTAGILLWSLRNEESIYRNGRVLKIPRKGWKFLRLPFKIDKLQRGIADLCKEENLMSQEELDQAFGISGILRRFKNDDWRKLEKLEKLGKTYSTIERQLLEYTKKVNTDEFEWETKNLKNLFAGTSWKKFASVAKELEKDFYEVYEIQNIAKKRVFIEQMPEWLSSASPNKLGELSAYENWIKEIKTDIEILNSRLNNIK